MAGIYIWALLFFFVFVCSFPWYVTLILVIVSLLVNFITINKI